MSRKLKFPPRALGVRFIGLAADNAFIGCTSAARVLMATRQRDQTLELISPGVSSIQSGLEKDLYHHTHKVAIPVDAEILDVIPIVTQNSWRTTVFYKDVHSGELGHVELRNYYSGDGKHGFLYVPTDELKNYIGVNAFIPAGTPLLEAPSTLYEGEYNYGLELNTCIASMVETAEDGLKVSKSALKKMGFNEIATRQIHVGHDQEPLIVGNVNDNDIVVPEPGMVVRDDGVIMAVRDISEGIGAILTHKVHLSRINHDSDTVHQMAGGGGTVVDIWVTKSSSQSHVLHNPQLDSLADTCQAYQQAVITSYHRLKHHTTTIAPITEAFITNFILVASCAKYNKQALGLNINKTKHPPYLINITIAKPSFPSMAAKLSDRFSAKSVIVDIEEDDRMPIDQYGRRADVVVSREAGTNRNIVGRDHAQTIVSCIATATEMLLAMAGLKEKTLTIGKAKQCIRELPYGVREGMLDVLHDIFSLINKHQADSLAKYRDDKDEMMLLLSDCLHRGIVIGLPVDVVAAGNQGTTDHALPLGPLHIIKPLMASRFYRPPAPIQYTLFNGDVITTEESIQIAPVYYALLDKLAQDCSASYTTHRQIRGLSGIGNKFKKNTQPISDSSIKIYGNDECSVIAAVVGPVAMAKHVRDVSDPRYNAASINRVLQTGEFYPDIPLTEVPVGRAPGSRLVAHVFAAAGIEFYYSKNQ